jgi:hypothetical protein
MLGNPKSGAFTYDSKLSFASTTSNGVAFAVNAIKKADKVDGTLKIAYVKGKYAVGKWSARSTSKMQKTERRHEDLSRPQPCMAIQRWTSVQRTALSQSAPAPSRRRGHRARLQGPE